MVNLAGSEQVSLCRFLETKPELANYTFFNSHYNVMHHAAGAPGSPVPSTYPTSASLSPVSSWCHSLSSCVCILYDAPGPGPGGVVAGIDAGAPIALQTPAGLV